MKRFLLKFTGREVGAIGAFQDFREVIDAENEARARIMIYDTHEHLSRLEVHEILPATAKKYQCALCGHIGEQTTNHFGQTYSWGHFNCCPKCPPHSKYPEYGGVTVWDCMETEASK
jgi:hypothetical protein